MTESIGTVSYAAAAVAFLFLSGLLAVSWRGRLQGAMLVAACFVSAIWASLMALQAWQPGSVRLIAEVFEVLRKSIWIAFLLMLLGYGDGARLLPVSLRRIAISVLIFWPQTLELSKLIKIDVSSMH